MGCTLGQWCRVEGVTPTADDKIDKSSVGITIFGKGRKREGERARAREGDRDRDREEKEKERERERERESTEQTKEGHTSLEKH
jgi:hypothetical protein